MGVFRSLGFGEGFVVENAQTVFLVAPFNSSAALGANSSNWITHGSWTPRIVNDPTQVPANALRLTPAARDLYGAIEYANKMPTSMGIDISVTIAMWGGCCADGLLFYLRDGRDTAKVFGGAGGGREAMSLRDEQSARMKHYKEGYKDAVGQVPSNQP